MESRFVPKKPQAFNDDNDEEEDPFMKDLAAEELDRSKKYLRGGSVAAYEEEEVGNKYLAHRLKSERRDRKMAAVRNADAEVLLPETAGYLELDDPTRSTKTVRQFELRENVDLRTANKSFSLALDHFGPYQVSYTRNGKHVLMSGERGHVALFDWKTKHLVKELHVKDRVYDSCFLQNETWFALAQDRNVHIYDKLGTELHILKEHHKSTHLDFLPYHWLLVSGGATGWLHWTDVSTGDLVTSSNGRTGPVRALRQNPTTAVMCAGHARGLVTMWTPNMPEPAVKMMCHRGPVQSIAMDRAGRVMVTAGLDSMVRIWDLRTYQQLRCFRTARAPTSVDVSQRGLLAVGHGCDVAIYDSSVMLDGASTSGAAPVRIEPYMQVRNEDRRDAVQRVRFAPWEDILGVGRTASFVSAIIPGSGDPNVDTMEANPFVTRKQRREADVQALLDKAPASSIMMEAQSLGAVDEDAGFEEGDEGTLEKPKFKPKFKSAGKNKASFRAKRKRIVADRDTLETRRQEMYAQKIKEREVPEKSISTKKKKGGVLDRFDKGGPW